jgi:GNAT superfamily N-acetyltransferase
MELYKLYLKERENAELYHDDMGFFTYVLKDGDMQVNDIFVKKEYRAIGIGQKYSSMIDKIAKENNCKAIYGFVCLKDPNWQGSYKFQEKMGYKFLRNEDTLFVLKKEL